MALHDFGDNLHGDLGKVLFVSLKNRIAALNVCFDLSHAEGFQNPRHRLDATIFEIFDAMARNGVHVQTIIERIRRLVRLSLGE